MMKKLFLYFSACVIAFLDQLTKYLAVHFFSYTTNTGAAFGLFPDSTFILSLISLVVALVVIVLIKIYPYPEFALLLGGILGNLIDRTFRGYVVDFINLGWWPSFNVADTASTLAVLFLILRMRKKD